MEDSLEVNRTESRMEFPQILHAMADQLKEFKKITKVAERAKLFAYINGLQLKMLNTPDRITHAPFSLFASPFPKKILQQAREVQLDFNLLMHKVAHDHDFLYESLKSVLKVDEFTNNVWKIYETVRNQTDKQPISLGLFRSDYLLDTNGTGNFDDIQLKQVEFNMMAAGSAGLSSRMREFHRFNMTLAGITFDEDKMPVNECCSAMSRGIEKAWTIYGKQEAYVLFIVCAETILRMDQVCMEKEIFNINRLCKVIYRTLDDMVMEGELNASNELIIDNKEVAVIYFRAGIAPEECKNPKVWDARLKMERSKAIKCPTVAYQLAGTKKIQQELSKKGAVEKFLKNTLSVKRVRQTIMPQFSLDKGAEGDIMLAKAIESPHEFVLKPQRDGGGHNLFEDNISNFLREIKDSDERSAYTLMKRMLPYSYKNYFVTSSNPEIQYDNLDTELGIFGVLIGTSTEILENTECGHLMRTKPANCNDGGICTGQSVYDSPYCISDISEMFHTQ